MKVTFVIPYDGPAGGIRVVARHAQLLRARGHDVTVVSAPRRINWLREAVKYVLYREGVLAEPREKRSYFEGVDVERHVIDSPRPIEERDVPDADVIIATWWETAEWIQPMSAAKGRKAYLIQHDETWFGAPRDRIDATWRFDMYRLGVSRWIVETVAERVGLPVALVQNSVDLDLFHADPRGKQPRPTLGMLYSPASLKGCDLGLEAIERVRTQLGDVRIQIFAARSPSKRLPLPRGAEFSRRPPQDRIREIYATSDVWLCPSRAEGYGLPPVEAMACRTPVVSAAVGALPDLVETGRDGVLVPPGDVEGMAAGMLRVLRLEDAQWRRWSESARTAAASFTWEDAAALMEGHLLAAAAGERPRELAAASA